MTALRAEDFPSLQPRFNQTDDFAAIFQANLELTQLFSNAHDGKETHGWSVCITARRLLTDLSLLVSTVCYKVSLKPAKLWWRICQVHRRFSRCTAILEQHLGSLQCICANEGFFDLLVRIPEAVR